MIKPLYDRVVIKRTDEEDVTPGGIIIPGTAQEKSQKGQVVAVGNGRISPDGVVSPMQVKTGDTILFGKYSGTELKLHGEDFLILNESDIIGIYE